MTVRTILKCWNRLEIRGLENLPAQPPFVMVANHSSHLDTIVLASMLSLRWRDQVSPLAAGDYFFATPPLAGFSAVILNALPIWRNRRGGQRHELGDLRERLINQQAIYIVFPEGSRSRDGQLHEFQARLCHARRGHGNSGFAVPSVGQFRRDAARRRHRAPPENHPANRCAAGF